MEPDIGPQWRDPSGPESGIFCQTLSCYALYRTQGEAWTRCEANALSFAGQVSGSTSNKHFYPVASVARFALDLGTAI